MSTNTSGATAQVDVRGPRFTAWVTTAVLVLALIVSAFSPIGAAVLLAAQAVVFAIGAFLNAAFAICLGCQLYPLVARFRRAPSPA